MSNRIELSRRRILAGIGAAGVASVGAGLGTSAYFSDEETYENNVLAAGSLDLKVDWEEHYSDWSEDEAEGIDGDILMSEPEDPEGFTALPDPENPLIWVPGVDTEGSDLRTFMDNTAIEAYPDEDNNGVQDDFRMDELFDECEDLADTPDDLDPTEGLRTENEDTLIDGETTAPLVNLQDVKPGDFGELTLSMHLCDNPGYVWMNGELVEASENGLTEPEMEDEDEDQFYNESSEQVELKEGEEGPAEVELLDEIQTLFWYDEDGDNVYEPAGMGGATDVALVADISGSMSQPANGGTKLDEAKDAGETLVETLDSDDNATGVTFSEEAARPFDLQTMDASGRSALKTAINAATPQSTTNIQEGVIYATEELVEDDGVFTRLDTNPSSLTARNSEQVMVVLSDGVANQYKDENGELQFDGSVPASGDPSDNAATNAAVEAAQVAKGNGIRVFTVGFALGELSDDEQTLAQNTLEEMASPGDFYTDVETGDLAETLSRIAQTIAGEKCFWRGSLRETLNVLEGKDEEGGATAGPDLGIPLDGDRDTDYDEIVEENGVRRPDDGADSNRECFPNSITSDIGFAWWLPVDHGNEVQSDSVQFDLGFYTEQCRHNDGSGQAAENSAD